MATSTTNPSANSQPDRPLKRPATSFMENEHYVRRNKRMMKQTKLTSWFDAWEFDAVGKALLTSASSGAAAVSCDTGMQGDGSVPVSPIRTELSLQDALERVAVWKTRLYGMPHAIESTAAIAQLFLREATGSSTITELRLAFSCAILRSINGLADVMQQQRAVAASVASLCGHLGIPAWLVDIRHESTHNQLPPLPVLRMAASTLLDYYRQVYWEPLAMSRQADLERATNLLQAYKAATSNSKPPTSASKAASVVPEKTIETTTNEEPNDDDSSSSDEEETKDWHNSSKNDIWGSSIGTSSNRFAALLDSKLTKKKVEVQPPAKPAPKKKAKKPRPEPGTPTAASCARDYVKSKLPFDIAYQSALSFLVWGGEGSGSPAGRGALIPGSPGSFPESAKGAEKVRQRYNVLIVALCKEWPGFLSTLLVHLIDFILSIESAAEQQGMDAGSTRKLFFLNAWVRHLLSRRFLISVDKSTKDLPAIEIADTTESFPPLSVYKALSFPLNGLCDRCSNIEKDDSSPCRSTSLQLAELFVHILGDDRMPAFGADVTQEPAVTVEKKPAKSEVTLPPQEAASQTNGVSLAEMEALLSNGHPPTSDSNPLPVDDDDATPATNTPRTAWLRCKSWDPCSLGTVPGYPM